MLSEVVETQRQAAERRGLELRLSPPKEKPPKVEMDREKIHQSIFNLIDNAIKYTEKGLIEVSAVPVEHGKAVQISVRDTGVGMNSEDKEKLFQKFSRASGADINPSGLGIGLYLAYRMVKDHGGKIWAESAGKGKGSTFFVQLPVHSELAVERGELVERNGS